MTSNGFTDLMLKLNIYSMILEHDKTLMNTYQDKQNYIISCDDGNCYVKGSTEDLCKLFGMIFNIILKKIDLEELENLINLSIVYSKILYNEEDTK